MNTFPLRLRVLPLVFLHLACPGPNSNTSDSGQPGAGPLCGNGSVDVGEECDDGNQVSVDGCTTSCRNSCHANSDCDDRDPCTTDLCSATGAGFACSRTIAVRAACDDGNSCTDGDVCNASGQCVSGSNRCDCTTRADCTVKEDGDLCNGTLDCVNKKCVIDPGTVVTCDSAQDGACRKNRCNPATGVCSLQNEVNGRSCDDGLFCTAADACQNGTCVGAQSPCPAAGCSLGCDEAQDKCLPADAGTSCRGAAGPCDLAEACDGRSAVCPADLRRGSGTICRARAGACDLPEVCNGISAACPDDSVEPLGVLCRTTTGLCDAPESCDGTSTNCPADQVAPATTTCRPANGDCDVAERCTGATKDCPGDGFAAPSVACRPSRGGCDLAESCSGAGPECPADAVRPPATVCRPANGLCDVAERCDGNNAGCPADLFQGQGSECRSARGSCDVAEVCTGLSSACPADLRRPDQSSCRPAAGTCDLEEVCDGLSDECPADQLRSVGAECRAAAGSCDESELCSGTSAICPPDARKNSSAVCRPAAGVCDAAERCDGLAAACPTDTFSDPGTVCRVAANTCDVAERCSGSAAACPADAFQPRHTACNDSDPCTEGDACDGLGICNVSRATAPSAPSSLWPLSGAYSGSLHAAPEMLSLRPQLRFRGAANDGCGPPAYEVQVDDSCSPVTFPECTFPSPEAVASGLSGTSWRPEANLPVSTVVPVGRRYYWRERACRGTSCSAWSAIRSLEVGRVANDLNGDGYSDIAAGAPELNGGSGAVLVVLGNPGTGENSGRQLLPPALDAGQRFGAVLVAGDLNADGLADLVVGAPLAPGALGLEEGRLYIYHGRSGGPAPTADQVVVAPAPQALARFGSGLAAEGDINGDGYADLVVGAPGTDAVAMAASGVGFVFLGGPAGVDALAPWGVPNPSPGANARFGEGAAASDLSNDGFADVAFGSSGARRLNVLLGSATEVLPPIPGNVVGDVSAGQGAITLGGDHDADGWPNLVVGMRAWCCYANGIFLYNGTQAAMSPQPAWTKGVYYPDEFGYGLSNGGDFNGDGRYEVVAGTPAAWNGGPGFIEVANAASSGITIVTTLSNPGGAPGGRFGEALTARGDVNGDGYSDLIVGAPGQNSVYLYLGRSTGLASAPDRGIAGGGALGRGMPR